MIPPHQEYFKALREQYVTGDTTELSYRSPFATFLKIIRPDCFLIEEPKRDKVFGAPDYKVFSRSHKVGYIETKDLGLGLDDLLSKEQIKKYSKSIDNYILTNYVRFILLRNGEKVLDVHLCSPDDLRNPRFKVSPGRIAELSQLMDSFFDYVVPSITSSKQLAYHLSQKAIIIKFIAKEQLGEDLIQVRGKGTPSSIYDFYLGLEEMIHDISIDDCVDAYAQTITYGLFLAKIQCQGALKREMVDHCLPRNIPVIKRVFINIAGQSLPSNMVWIVDEILDVLNATDITTILAEMDSRGKRDKDPFSHFYEDFLSEYDSEKREKRGVYYTPRPVVNYITKSIEWVLKNDFEHDMGFADDTVTVLDPAVGTGTFLWLVYLRTLGEMKRRGLGGLMRSKIQNHILKDFYGLEVLITPYIIAHLKLALILKNWFYELQEGERVPVYLTNSLDQSEDHGVIPFLREINEERKIAQEVILKKPILVILGNPPYSGMSANKGVWIDGLLKSEYTRGDGSHDEGYYRVDGKPLGERNSKWLQDDYVKFIRLAQWKVDKAGKGIIGFITNHAWLDNPTFRGMRQSLMESFDQVMILNLHGSAARSKDSKDENVFDIQQGVTIVLLVKNPNSTTKHVMYADLMGSREEKYAWLDRNFCYTTKWETLNPTSPFYLFIPVDKDLQKIYDSFWKLTDIFPVNNVGIVTARDDLTIQFTPDAVWTTILKFSTISPEQAREQFQLGKDARDWKVHLAQNDLIDSGTTREKIIPILYRPFDRRYTYFTGRSRGFHCMPRGELMQHMLRPNLGLISARSNKSYTMDHFFCTDSIMEAKCGESTTQSYLFPLYLYTAEERRPNINPSILAELENRYGVRILPEEIFSYVYGLTYSTQYREKYAQFLRIDFPRVPFPDDYETFATLFGLGLEMVELHLMRKSLPVTVKFDIEGTNQVESVKYKEGKVFINKTQYFEGIPEEVWQFKIGGYPVLAKWLKYRKTLSSHEVEHAIQIVEIIKETIRIMKEIDHSTAWV